MAASVLDNFMLEGWPAIFRISVALLRLYEQELLQADSMHELMETLGSMNQPDDRLSILLAVAANELLPEDYASFELMYFTVQVVTKL